MWKASARDSSTKLPPHWAFPALRTEHNPEAAALQRLSWQGLHRGRQSETGEGTSQLRGFAKAVAPSRNAGS